jgi:hypothetical protein
MTTPSAAVDGVIRCTHCGQYRVMDGEPLNMMISMYLIHVMRDHPDVIKMAQEVADSLTVSFNWRTQPVPPF